MNGDTYSSRDSGRQRTDHRPRHDREEGRDRDRDRRDPRERRRSRSPHQRSSRREYEENSYASSRNYREREREDRYGGRDRRDEVRDWDRDRGGRRDGGRRDDRERPPRRDRDLFDDRRGGGGRGVGAAGGGGDRSGREDRDEFAAQNRGPRESSPPKPREPTPDLTDTIPINERKRRLTQWDIKPPGYENVTAEQAKLSGMFPLPGAPRQQPMDPSKLQAFMNQPSNVATTTALKPSNARQSKRLFIFNVPPSASEDTIINFFNLQLNGLNVTRNTDPCVSANISNDKSFALVEFKSATDATVALALDGITMEEHYGGTNGASNGSVQGLDIKRPKDYIVPTPDDDAYLDGVSSEVPDSSNKISITKLPTFLNDEQIKELLASFGELRAFVLVKDNSTEESRGIAFCEYSDSSATPMAVEGLDGMEISGANIKVALASIGFQQAAGLEMGVNAMSMFAGTTSNDLEESRVLCLLNMVTAEELIDNDEYEEIKEDISEECGKYGTVLDIKLPRPSGGSRQSAGVGKIYVKFSDSASATAALKALAGRKFADRTVVTTYFDEATFDVNGW